MHLAELYCRLYFPCHLVSGRWAGGAIWQDVPGQLDHPCCASFGLAICHTGSVFWLGSAICHRDIGMYTLAVCVLAWLSYMSP